MFTQVQLEHDTRVEIKYGVKLDKPEGELFTTTMWLDYDAYTQYPKIAAGRGVRTSEGGPYWCIRKVFESVRNREDLPVNAHIETIVEIN